jgi:3-dehydroquinate synthase
MSDVSFQPPLWISLPTPARHYAIRIQRGLLPFTGELIRNALPKATQALVITQEVIESHFGQTVQQSLSEAGFLVRTTTIPTGETAKCLAQAEALYQTALDFGLSRHDPIIALGGGVVGDLAGFVAATYFRGVPFVQIPTTLLAQVDSSVGGKVAVNFATSKNGVGCFYQPQLVIIDPNTLATLPAREVLAGLGEVVKYGLIESSISPNHQPVDATFLDWLEAQAQTPWQQWHQADQAIWETLITRCCQMKAAVVAQDETEQSGLRALLNLGHTFAHAYEALTHYNTLLHGEAVAIGLVDACRLSANMGWSAAALSSRVEALLQQLGLTLTRPQQLVPPVTAPLSIDEIIALMRHDKKASGGQFTLVLPQGPVGHAIVTSDVTEAYIRAVLAPPPDA